MKRLSDEAIRDTIYELPFGCTEIEQGQAVARAAEDERDRQWIEWIVVNGFAQMVDTLPLDKGDVIIPADKWQSLWQQVEGGQVSSAGPVPIGRKCICPIMDNQEGIGGMLQRPVINLNCPVHGDKSDTGKAPKLALEE